MITHGHTIYPLASPSTFSYIYEQLRHERIKSMALILEHTDSAYFPCFKTMFKNVVTALAESRDITLYLSPLMKHFLQFEETDFSECKPLLKPLMHVVCLVRPVPYQSDSPVEGIMDVIDVSVMGKLQLLSHIVEADCAAQADRQSHYPAGEEVPRSLVHLS